MTVKATKQIQIQRNYEYI